MQKIQYGSRSIEFEVIPAKRKTLSITVEPDTSVVVRMPEEATMEKVLDKVEKKARWIIKQQRFFESFLPITPKREYVSGESHYYLGKQYKLKVFTGKVNQVKLQRGILHVTTRDKSPDKVKLLLGAWYKNHAERKFHTIIKSSLTKFEKYKIQPTGIELKRMEKRWGSCTPSGKIILNPEIIKAPTHCIEYVVIHELCHLVHNNHSKHFYALQEKILPDWRRWKNRLEKIMI